MEREGRGQDWWGEDLDGREGERGQTGGEGGEL